MSFESYCKLVILGILGRLATPFKKDSINLLKTLMFRCMQKINCIPNFVLEISQIYYKVFWILENCSLLSWDIAKILHSCYFEYFRHAWLHPSDMTVPKYILWILWSLSLQKLTLSLAFFSRYCKDFANLLFWVLWARLSPILIVSTCKKVCLSTCKKSTSCLPFFFFLIGIHPI